MWAVISNGVGRMVGYQRVREDFPLTDGEIMRVDYDPKGMILTEEGRLEVGDPVPTFRPLPNDVFHAMRDTLGITDEQVETAIAAMTEAGIERNLALRRFHSAVHYQRDSELLNGLAVALGVSQFDLDTAWRQAEELL